MAEDVVRGGGVVEGEAGEVVKFGGEFVDEAGVVDGDAADLVG